MNMITETLDVSIRKINTPGIIITHTPKWLLDSILESANKHGSQVQDPITVIKKGTKYFIIDKFEFYEAALQTKQKTIRVLVSDSTYDPLVAHIIATSKAKINPIRKIRAIKSMFMDSDPNDLLAKTLRLDSYYSLLLGISFTRQIESKLEEILDYAISIGIANTEPPIKFFEIVAAASSPLQIIQNIHEHFSTCNKSSFFWSTVLAEIATETKKKVGKDLPKDRQFDCGCGKKYLISDNNKAEIILESDEFLHKMSTEGDISHPINYLSEKYTKHIGTPDNLSVFKFTSLEVAAKKFPKTSIPVIVIVNKETINESR
jgi:hypothetical protein